MNDFQNSDYQDNQPDSKVFLTEQNRKDYGYIRQQLFKAIQKNTRHYASDIPLEDQQKFRIKFKNLLIDHANVVLRAFRKTVVYTKNDPRPKQLANTHILPSNQILKERNSLLQKVLSKALTYNKETIVPQLDIKIKTEVPTEFFKIDNGMKIPIEDLLPLITNSAYEKRINAIRAREQQYVTAMKNIEEQMQTRQILWKKQKKIIHHLFENAPKDYHQKKDKQFEDDLSFG